MYLKSLFRGLIIEFLFFFVLFIAGCMAGPNFHPPPAPQPQRYTETPLPRKTTTAASPGGQAQYFVPCQDIPAQWWALFHSPDLNALIEQGIINNPTIAAARAALRVAQENLRAEVGMLLPLVTGQSNAGKQRFTGATIGQSTVAPTEFNLFNAAINVSYTFDVFGGIRRQLEALGAQVDFQQFELEATYLNLTANIVTTAITEASLRAQIQATHELIKAEEKTLKIIKGQFSLGGASGADVYSQETLLAQTIAMLPPLEKNLTQTRNALAALIGQLPSESCIPYFDLNQLHLPRHLPLSIPSALVRQRPDVQAAEALMHAANAQIGVATANMLPQFTLTAVYGTEATQLKNLFRERTTYWNYMFQMLQTLFDAGTLSAQRRAAIAAYQQAAAQYQQTVLQAFQNVADSLRAVEMDAYELRAQAQAEASAYKSLDISRKQFTLGAINYPTLLLAELQYQRAKIARIQAQAQRYIDTAALFQALGGGWWNRPLLPPSEIKAGGLEKIIGDFI